jgi:hypothetical protein
VRIVDLGSAAIQPSKTTVYQPVLCAVQDPIFLRVCLVALEPKASQRINEDERRRRIMLAKIISTWRWAGRDIDGTGTFADGVYPLTLSDQYAFDRDHGLRSSYGRDYTSASKLEAAPPAFA